MFQLVALKLSELCSLYLQLAAVYIKNSPRCPPTFPTPQLGPNQTKRLDGSLETAGREDGNDEEGKEDEGNYTRW